MFFQRFERANLLNIWKILFKFDAKSYDNMDNIVENGEWWTAPAESEDGQLVMVTGRKDVAKFRENPRFSIRVEVTWPYNGNNGMPDVGTSELMDEVQARLMREFRRDPVAVLTGIYTGAGERNWIFYTLSTHIFGRKLNEALADLPVLPLKIYCENDPQWEEYDEMSKAEVE